MAVLRVLWLVLVRVRTRTYLGRRSEESGHVARDVCTVPAQRQHLVSVRVRVRVRVGVRVSLRSSGPAAAPGSG